MKILFSKKISLKTKLISAILFLVFILIINYFINLKSYFNTFINPVYIFLNKSYFIFNNMIENKNINSNLKKQNKYLFIQLLKNKYEILQLKQLKHDNKELRKLLILPIVNKDNIKTIFAEKLPIYFNFDSDEILINKGSINNIHVGQLVINDLGLVGQVISINKSTSHVRLICSTQSFISVQSIKTNIKFAIKGNGCKYSLMSEILPKNININKGDILVISALYDNLLQGYPVAIVTTSSNTNFKNIRLNYVNVSPLFKISELKYLLLISD
ncbi:rod shape-determining protein MreC [Enterobacteriaceae endosymbiont of Plateumaris consimilis]|uniref:rod shape-determining protein MreC n=1 Tax=Enterobacteriaceae endosymbiont of Plateumaris consimilis TaxID=2675794 RepID=UPI001448E973|nr:rod shape-determining protein MreC [Enterobacteriaceae endosymbiont of Plateumaris consimilis]QJC28434.1 rod shape-determining protein MreC [Enterobacteriaceae endosymbiont of Plateumaris consimilis]